MDHNSGTASTSLGQDSWRMRAQQPSRNSTWLHSNMREQLFIYRGDYLRRALGVLGGHSGVDTLRGMVFCGG